MFKADYIERQLQMISAALAKSFFNREQTFYEITDPYRNEDANELNKRLMDFLAEGKINEAENLLFEAIVNDKCVDSDYLRVALDFYLKLDQYCDDYLESCDFSRVEINEGWTAFTMLFPDEELNG